MEKSRIGMAFVCFWLLVIGLWSWMPRQPLEKVAFQPRSVAGQAEIAEEIPKDLAPLYFSFTEPLFPPPPSPLPDTDGNPDPVVKKAEAQQKQADAHVEYERGGWFVWRKPDTGTNQAISGQELRRKLRSLPGKKNLLVVSFEKFALWGTPHENVQTLLKQLEQQFKEDGFQKVVFHQETASGPYDLGERIEVTLPKQKGL
ncbi:MAG: hypothetical protein K1Y36_24715 [Blastocatellia bacterium]|nr:hypothetical protein [Blastocatellia bacterium]